MITARSKSRCGFTIIELVITTAIMVIVGFAIGVVIVDGQTGWNHMYDRINSDVVTDSYVARRKFDSVMRSASRGRFVLDSAGNWIEVYYYANYHSVALDRYARFYTADGDLNLEYGQLNPRATLGVETICSNVSGCVFKQIGRSIQMVLTLDNGTQTNTIVSSAVTHNQ